MNQFRYFVAIILLAVSIVACKKKEQIVTAIPQQPVMPPVDYIKMQVGNYWIYRHYQVDGNGVATATATYDSTYIEKDTMINEKRYFKYCTAELLTTSYIREIELFRDSSGYVVNNFGRIIFSSKNLDGVLKTYAWGPNAATPDTFVVTERMGDIDKGISVEAGQFTTYTFKRIYTYQSGPKKGSSLIINYRYGKDVGLVMDNSISYFNGFQFERRLVRYRIMQVVS